MTMVAVSRPDKKSAGAITWEREGAGGGARRGMSRGNTAQPCARGGGEEGRCTLKRAVAPVPSWRLKAEGRGAEGGGGFGRGAADLDGEERGEHGVVEAQPRGLAPELALQGHLVCQARKERMVVGGGGVRGGPGGAREVGAKAGRPPP